MAATEGLVEQSAENALVKKSLGWNIGTITLNSSKKLNALSAPVIGDSLAVLSDLKKSATGVGILRAL